MKKTTRKSAFIRFTSPAKRSVIAAIDLARQVGPRLGICSDRQTLESAHSKFQTMLRDRRLGASSAPLRFTKAEKRAIVDSAILVRGLLDQAIATLYKRNWQG